MNEILLFLSNYKDEAKEAVYASDEGEIRGTQTSDAPTKYLLKRAKKEGKEIDRILCITSSMVKQKGLAEFDGMVGVCCKELSLKKPDIITIPYDYAEVDTKALSNIEKLNQIYGRITSYVKAGDQIYIDYTSGLRDISFFMTVLIRYMEYIGAKCNQIVYSNFSDHKVVSVNYIYALFDVINGISEFMQSGNSNLLNRTILKSAEIEKKYPQIKQLLESMKCFTDMIALCTVDRKMDDVLKSLRQAIRDVQKMKNEIHSEDEIAIQMLKNLLGEIQKKLFLNEQEKGMSYLQIIRWCLENNLLQQAITFYIEKTPDIFYHAKLLSWIESSKKSNHSGSAESAVQFYDVLYDEIGRDDSFAVFSDILRKQKDTGESYKKIAGMMKKEQPDCNWNRIEGTLENVEGYLGQMYEHGSLCKLPAVVIEEIKKTVNANTKDRARNTIVSNEGVRKLFYYKKNEKEETYPKKVAALERLKERKDQSYGRIHNQDLLECLEYYLVLKTIRNQINHANESEGYEVVTEYLKQNRKSYSTEISVDNIVWIITAGVNKIQSIISAPEYQCGENVKEEDAAEKGLAGSLDTIEYGETLCVQVVQIDGNSAIVEDGKGNRGELKNKKMTAKTKKLFDSNQITGKKLTVKCVNMISKKCPYMVEEI